MVRIFLIALSLLALANPQGLVGGVIRGSGGAGGGTVSYVGSGTITRVAAATTITPPISAGSNGDLLIASCITDLDQAVTQASWTQITSITSSSSRSSIFYLVDVGTSSYDFTVATADEITCLISRFSKTSGTWTISDYGSAAASAATSINIPTVTASKDNSMALVMVGNDDPQTVSTAPSGMTEAALYGADDPVLGVYYLARNTGDLSGLSATLLGASDPSTIAIMIEAQ